MTKEASGPLGGVTVLDLCSYIAGPYGCTLLADLGASVIKIESPQGDMLRQFPSSLAGESRFFLGTNRGKRALALDLKQPEGLAVLHRMVETADAGPALLELELLDPALFFPFHPEGAALLAGALARLLA